MTLGDQFFDILELLPGTGLEQEAMYADLSDGGFEYERINLRPWHRAYRLFGHLLFGRKLYVLGGPFFSVEVGNDYHQDTAPTNEGHKLGLVASVSGLEEVSILFSVATTQCCMADEVAHSSISAAFHNWLVRLEVIARRRWNDWIHHLYPQCLCQTGMPTWWGWGPLSFHNDARISFGI